MSTRTMVVVLILGFLLSVASLVSLPKKNIQSVSVDDQVEETYYSKGIKEDSLGNYQRAIIEFTKAIELDSTKAIAYYKRATSLANSGDLEQAIIDFDKANKIE